MIYLDYNATSPLRPFVKDTMAHAMDISGNPSSVHGAGREARRVVEDARQAVANSVGVEPVNVIFTSGGTEANNMALAAHNYDVILISAIEHDSIINIKDTIFLTIPVDSNGVVDHDALEKLLKDHNGQKILVSVMMANNETGVIQPIHGIAELAHEYGAHIHTDAVQAWGKVPVHFDTLDVDLMTIAAHKVGGPKGVGALIARENFPVKSLLSGGGQERSRRAGTENIPAIAGFGALAEKIDDVLAEWESLSTLRADLEDFLIENDHTIYSTDAKRLPNTICVAIDTSAETKVMQMDLKNIAISAGSACSSGKITPSHVLKAMGLDDTAARQAVRISIGWGTTADDIAAFKKAWPQ